MEKARNTLGDDSTKLCIVSKGNEMSKWQISQLRAAEKRGDLIKMDTRGKWTHCNWEDVKAN